jgi:hypothetical protein
MAEDDRRCRRSCLAAPSVLVCCLALSLPVAASDFIGVWRVDQVGEGVKLDFPDNGFDGACIRFTNGMEEAGEVKVESQIVRHRLDAVRFHATGDIAPDNIHVQVTVKGKTAWIGAGLSFDQTVELPLDGWEATFHIAKLEPSTAAFEVSLCDLEFVAAEWTVRHTSDCAGLDFDIRDDRLVLRADEDWAVLGREMKGGMGIFGLSPQWLAGQGDVYLHSSFPGETFDVAVVSGGSPILEAEEGLSQPVSIDPASEDPIDFVAKVKTPAPGLAVWHASLDWGPPSAPDAADGASPGSAGDAFGTADAICSAADGSLVDGLAADGSGCPTPPKHKGGGCSAMPSAVPLPWGLLALALAGVLARRLLSMSRCVVAAVAPRRPLGCPFPLPGNRIGPGSRSCRILPRPLDTPE